MKHTIGSIRCSTSFIMLFIALICMLSTVEPAAAREHTVGFTGGTAFLIGDNTDSDAGPSIGLTYETSFNPLLSAGIEGQYQRVSGTSRITDPTSIFYGPHSFDTTFIIVGLFSKLSLPDTFIQPYLSVGTGGALWFSGNRGDIRFLPLKDNISWSVDPFARIGTGVAVDLGTNFTLDIGTKAYYYFSDELDNVDGGYVSGTSSSNDYTIQMGFNLSYRFGEKAEPPRDTTPGMRRVEPEPPAPAEAPPAETTAPPDDARAVPEQEEESEPEEAVADTTMIDSGAEPVPVDETPQAPDMESVTPLPEPPEVDHPVEQRPVPVQPSRPPAGNYFVHIASFPTIDEANEMATEISSRNYRTRVSSIDREELGIWYRVFVGPYTTRAAAEQTAERFIALGLSDYAAVIELEE